MTIKKHLAYENFNAIFEFPEQFTRAFKMHNIFQKGVRFWERAYNMLISG